MPDNRVKYRFQRRDIGRSPVEITSFRSCPLLTKNPDNYVLETYKLETDRYVGPPNYQLIFDLLNIGRYANSNFTMIRDARYYLLK